MSKKTKPEVLDFDEWQCLRCDFVTDQQGRDGMNILLDHIERTHGIPRDEAKNATGGATSHMNATKWFQWSYSYSHGGTPLIGRVVRQKRSKDDAMYWEEAK